MGKVAPLQNTGERKLTIVGAGMMGMGGGMGNHEMSFSFDGVPFDEYSDASGRLRRKWRKATKGTILDKGERQRRRSLKEKTQAQELKNATEATKALAKEDKSDAEIAKALAETSKTSTGLSNDASTSTKLSTPAKIAIGVGIAAVLTGVTILIIKRMKKGKGGK